MNNNNHNNHNQSNPIQSLPNKLLKHKRKIEIFDQKLASISNGTSKELQMELNKIEQYKHFKLQLLEKFKLNDINENNQLYQPQINAIQSQQNQLIQQFNQYCINQLQRIKLQIQKTNHPININFEQLYDEFIELNDIKTNRNNNLNSNQYKMNNKNLRSCRYKKKGIFPPDPSLQAHEIDDDLDFLMQEAMKKNIEIDADILMINKRRKQRKRKFVNYKEPEIEEEDMNEIKEICNKLSMEWTNKQLTVRLYSYKEHLDVYKDIFHWISNCDKKKRNKIINELTTNTLRDIQVKLRSPGTVGVKLAMATGIKQKLNILESKYQCLK